ncbi:MAG: hypothetical protein NVS3B2_04630 [Ramlibacter sp.]
MSARRWIKFWPQDWQREPALRICSLAARGLWMDLLCIMHDGTPYGHLTINAQVPTPAQLGRITGSAESEVAGLLGELEAARVFSRTPAGIIYSRRLVRDALAGEKAAQDGATGGNPHLRRGVVPKAARVRPYRRSDAPEKTARIFQKRGGHCWWCNVALTPDVPGPTFFHVDHLVPVCDGGGNEESNLVPACAKCNHARAQRSWEEASDTNLRNSDSADLRNSDTELRNSDTSNLRKSGKTDTESEPNPLKSAATHKRSDVNVGINSDVNLQEAEAESEDREGREREARPSAPAPAPSTAKPKRRAAPNRARRIPDDWQPDDAGMACAAQHGVDLAAEVPNFMNYYRATGGGNGESRDWQATWRLWCGRAPQFARRGPPAYQRQLSARDENAERIWARMERNAAAARANGHDAPAPFDPDRGDIDHDDFALPGMRRVQ